jgi:hypothetical protein
MLKFKNLCFVIVVLFSMLILMGCASTPKKTGYLMDYDKLTKGQYLDNYWVNTPLVTKKKYSKISLSSISINRISDKKGVTAENCRDWLRNFLIKAAGSSGINILTKEDSTEVQVRLDIAITEMTPGSAGGRVFAGEFGMGHAWVQVEGSVVDIASNEPIALFSDRRRSSGAAGLKDIAGDSGPSLVRGMLEQIAVDIIKELTETFK